MYYAKNMALRAACVTCLTLVPLTWGLDLSYYWHLDGSKQQRACLDAARANPDVVKQLQTIAERCVKLIQSDLASLVKDHPVLAGVGQTKTEVPNANETEKVLCRLWLEKNTHSVETAAGTHLEPDKGGCILGVCVNNIVPPWDSRGHLVARFLVHEMEIRVTYTLKLSKENNGLYKPVRALIVQRYRAMCNEMKALQTAEDKAAGKSDGEYEIDLTQE